MVAVEEMDVREVTDLFFTRHAPTDPELRQFDSVLTQLATANILQLMQEHPDKFDARTVTTTAEEAEYRSKR